MTVALQVDKNQGWKYPADPELRELSRRNISEWYAKEGAGQTEFTILQILEMVLSEKSYKKAGHYDDWGERWEWEKRSGEGEWYRVVVYIGCAGIYARVHDRKMNRAYFAPPNGYSKTVNSFLKQLDLAIRNHK